MYLQMQIHEILELIQVTIKITVTHTHKFFLTLMCLDIQIYTIHLHHIRAIEWRFVLANIKVIAVSNLRTCPISISRDAI